MVVLFCLRSKVELDLEGAVTCPNYTAGPGFEPSSEVLRPLFAFCSILLWVWENESLGVRRPDLKDAPWENGNCGGGGGFLARMLRAAALPSDAVCGSGLKDRKGGGAGSERGRGGSLCAYEREDPMRGDSHLNARLLLHKSALQVGRKGSFFFFELLFA